MDRGRAPGQPGGLGCAVLPSGSLRRRPPPPRPRRSVAFRAGRGFRGPATAATKAARGGPAAGGGRRGRPRTAFDGNRPDRAARCLDRTPARRNLLGVSFPRPVPVRIHQAAGGNPFYALEIATMSRPTAEHLNLNALAPAEQAGIVRVRACSSRLATRPTRSRCSPRRVASGSEEYSADPKSGCVNSIRPSAGAATSLARSATARPPTPRRQPPSTGCDPLSRARFRPA